MPWKMQCFTLQSMGHTNHKFPVYAHGNVQTHLKSIVVQVHGNLEMRLLQEIAGILQQKSPKFKLVELALYNELK